MHKWEGNKIKQFIKKHGMRAQDKVQWKGLIHGNESTGSTEGREFLDQQRVIISFPRRLCSMELVNYTMIDVLNNHSIPGKLPIWFNYMRVHVLSIT
jgi:hypothetical protein